MARIFYFAWVREKIGLPEETLTLPEEISDVAGLLSFLRAKGEPYASVLADPNLRIAINQTYARPQDACTDRDEIAIFPPVSGG